MSNISFDNAYLLLIAVPLIVLSVIPFAIAVRRENRNGHNVFSMVTHVIIAVVLAFAAAGTSYVTVITETHVYVVADVSYSAKSNLDTIDGYIKNLDLPRNSKLGLVCFGKDYELVCEPDEPANVPSVKVATVDDTETNAAAALTYTGTLFRTGVIKRIVLITDGKQTDASADNSIRRAVDGLINRNVKVDAIFLDDNPDPESYREVQISGVSVTEKVYLDSEQRAAITVQSSYDTEADLTLIRNGELNGETHVNLTAGVNIVELALDTSEAGVFDYEVRLYAEGDSSDKNNSFLFSQSVSDEMRVLVVTQSWTDCVELVERYGAKASMDVYENDGSVSRTVKNTFANRYAGNADIKININSVNVPSTLEDLCKYDEFILANVDVSTLTNYTQFITNLDTAVAVFGKSLITTGNMYIQNRENDELRGLEDMLPVKYGNHDEEPKLYTLIIDASRSMGHLYHLKIAKELATRLVNLLNEDDYISIFKFDGVVEAIYNAKSLKDREEIVETIDGFEFANGTVIGSGMQRAYEQIKNLEYSEKQVMLISDGIAYGDDEYDPVLVAANMYADDIVTSVFDVGRQGDNSDGSNVNAALTLARLRLQNIAREGHGKYYYSNNAENLDGVIFGEVADNITASVVTEQTSVNVDIPRDAILEGVDLRVTKVPDISGYVYSGIKPSAKTVLTVNHRRASGNTVERPLFAHWNYGNGKVATFTSSLGDWTDSWTGQLKDVFCENLFQTSVPTEKNINPFTVKISREGMLARVNVEMITPRINASATLTLALPNGDTATEAMPFSGSAYYYEFAVADTGTYAVDITYTYNGKGFTERRAISFCYIDEYDAFSVFDSTELHRALDGRGTVSEDGSLKLENKESEVGKYVITFTVPLFIVACVLFVIDIAVRKLKWQDIRSFFGLGKKEGKKQ